MARDPGGPCATVAAEAPAMAPVCGDRPEGSRCERDVRATGRGGKPKHRSGTQNRRTRVPQGSPETRAGSQGARRGSQEGLPRPSGPVRTRPWVADEAPAYPSHPGFPRGADGAWVAHAALHLTPRTNPARQAPNRTIQPRSQPMSRAATANTTARPEWAKARRIVVKIGSSLLVDHAQRRAQRGLARLAGRRRRRAGQGRQAGDRRLLRRHRARAPRAGAAAGASCRSSSRRRRPPSARSRSPAPIRRCSRRARAHGRADPADARRHRGAPPLPQRAPDHRHAAGPARRAGRQRERHGGHHARSATATTTACPPASPA